MYTGVGGPRDEARGLALYEEALAKGSKTAQMNVGMRLLSSERTADEQARGARLLIDAHRRLKREEPESPARMAVALTLGKAYVFGWGVRKNARKGLRYLEEGATLPTADTESLVLLGTAYLEGKGGLAPDPSRGLLYLRRAADAGEPRAQWQVGWATLKGKGTSSSIPRRPTSGS